MSLLLGLGSLVKAGKHTDTKAWQLGDPGEATDPGFPSMLTAPEAMYGSSDVSQRKSRSENKGDPGLRGAPSPEPDQEVTVPQAKLKVTRGKKLE